MGTYLDVARIRAGIVIEEGHAIPDWELKAYERIEFGQLGDTIEFPCDDIYERLWRPLNFQLWRERAANLVTGDFWITILNIVEADDELYFYYC